MPLDPQVEVFLDELSSAAAPPLHQLSPAEARAVAIADSEALGAGEPIARTEDLSVPGLAGPVPIRVYVPAGSAPYPGLVYYHGGGWVIGSVPTHDGICRQLARAAGCVVVSVEYRLAPEHKYPAAVDDAYAATQWVFENAARLGVDAGRIAVGGDSAGGNLAAAVSLMARDRSSFRPVLQVLVYPITDYNLDTPSYHENADGYLLTRDTMRWFWECYLEREEDGLEPYASPLRAGDLRGLPEALVITAQYDPLRDEGEAYAARLREAEVGVQLSRYEGMIHAFVRRSDRFDQARRAVREIGEALQRAFA